MIYLHLFILIFSAKASLTLAQDYVPGEIVYQLRESSTIATGHRFLLRDLEYALGPRAVRSIDPMVTDPLGGVIRLNPEADFEKALAIVKENSEVEIAEPNFLYYADSDTSSANGTPNDPEFGRLWGLNNIGQKDSNGDQGFSGMDLNVLPIWRQGYHGNKNIVVAVIDTGIDWSHPDLAANLYTNPGEAGDKAVNGKDDDGNGFIDDIHGWNFVAKNNNSIDDEGHGSHCAGTIGGVGNNGVGIAGVNWEVSLLPVKFISDNGTGTLEDAVEALNYARLMKVKIMSNSWGSLATSKLLKKAVQAVNDAGILFVAAAGNNQYSNDQKPYYPASYDLPNVLSVAAINNQGFLASFSNFGTKTVHVAAPGVDVFSTFKNGEYARLSGTSMATPHVAGLAALLFSINPKWTSTEIKDRLIKSSKRVHMLAPFVAAKGTVNAYNALHGLFQTPDPAETQWKTKLMRVETEHPYKDNVDLKFEVRVPGAKKIRIHFVKVQTEKGRDRLTLTQSDGEAIADLTGEFLDFTTDYAIGDTISIDLNVDKTVYGYGFLIDKVQYIE